MIQKKLLISSLLLTATLSATSVMAAPMKPGFFIAAEGDWLWHDNSNTNYAILMTSPNTSSDGPNIFAKPGFAFSGGGYIGYLFKNNMDISFSFLIDDHNHTDTLIPGVGQGISDSLGSIGGFSTSAASQLSLRTDLYDFAMGQWKAITDRLAIHPFWGFSIADLNRVQAVTYSGLYKQLGISPVPGSTTTVTSLVQTVSVGPLLGMDGQYRIYNHLSLYGKTSIALLGGTLKSDSYSSNNQGVSNIAHNPLTINSNIFGLLQARIGFNYGMPIKNTPVVLSVGYRVTRTIDYFANANNDFMGPYAALSATI